MWTYANPVSIQFGSGSFANLKNIDLRGRIAKASLFAGLAFSNTKTALAHNLSYPITLGYGVQHGIACSFTLPVILRSVAGIGGFREASLQAILGDDLAAAAGSFEQFLSNLGVPVRLEEYGVPVEQWREIVDAAFVGKSGRNFVGEKPRFHAAAKALELV